MEAKLRNSRVVQLVALLAAGSCAITYAAPPLDSELRGTLARLPHRETVAGACVIDLSAGRVIFEHGADTRLMPASTMKLFAMAAALTELGAQFQFETVLAFDGQNLIVIGDGDPGFGDEKIQKNRGESVVAPFERWAEALRQAGINSVAGDLIIDETVFDEQHLHPSWERADLDNWYAAPVGGLNINDNCVDVTLTPARAGNSAPLVTMVPENHVARIINQSRSGGKGEPTLNHVFDSMEYKVGGRCPKTWTFGPASFPDPELLFADSLRTVLGRKGIVIHGKIRRTRVRLADGSLPPNIRMVASQNTPLVECLGRAGKDSQNLFAECLLKRAGYAWARRQGMQEPHGSWKLGGHAVAAMLGKLRVDPTGLVLADGSGLSRENRCSARQLAGLLASSYSQPFGPTLHDSLAVAGIDGSLKRRLKNSEGRVHAKTGTMKGIRTLAGYVDGDHGPRFAFAVMFNGYKGGAGPYKDIQDRFCRILSDASEPGPGGGRTLVGATTP